jgi:hypothetical protein
MSATPAEKETGLRRKDDVGRVNPPDIGGEKLWLYDLSPRPAEERDSGERTMGVGLTIQASMIS